MSSDREAGVSKVIGAGPRTAAMDGAGAPVAVVQDSPPLVAPVGRGGDGGPGLPREWHLPLLRFGAPFALAAILTLAALAFWPRAPFALDVGAPGDRLFLAGVHGDERVAEYSYRWTGNRAGADTVLMVQGWGGVRRVRATLRAQALPGRGAAEVQLLAGGVPVGAVVVDGTMAERTVEFEVPPGAWEGGKLVLALRSPLEPVPGDSRKLGVKLDTVRLEPLDRVPGAALPAAGSLLLLPLLLVGLLLGLVGGGAGWGATIARGGAALAPPLALALSLPWTLALLPAAILASGGALALRWRRRLPPALAAAWSALDRPRLAQWVAVAGIALYAVVLLGHVLQVPWIGHADYADNAVVARNLVRGRGFTVDYVAQFYRFWPAPHHPADTWPPLQPILIAPFFALFGPSTAVAKLPNLLLMMGLLWLVWRVGATLWSPRVGLLAALFLAVHDYLFEGVVYPLNDIAFTLLAFGCFLLLWTTAECGVRSAELRTTGVGEGTALPPLSHGPRPTAHDPQPSAFRLLPSILLGLLGGLLVLCKPSGAVLLAGGGAWALWWGWREGNLRAVLRGGVVAAAVALAVWAPWGVRNMMTFGVPFYSTESSDAWIIDYRDWENIYRVYAGRPNPPHPRQLVGFGLDQVLEKTTNQFRRLGNDLGGGRIVPLLALPLIVLGGCLVGDRRRRGLLGLVGAATVPYALFILLYWHYEKRYALFLLPWAALLAAAALWWLHDRLAAARGKALAAVVTAVALVVLLAPQVATISDRMPGQRRTPYSVTVGEWVRDNTPREAVIMSRNPWELSWHGEREAVMIPFDDLATIQAVVARYGVTHLQLDHLRDTRLRRAALAPLYRGEEVLGFRKVYDNRDEDGDGVLVYEFPKVGR